MRDVGALFLALVIASIWTARNRALVPPVAVAWLALCVLHAMFHLEHLDGLSGVDQAVLLSSLLAVPILSITALATSRWASLRDRNLLSREAAG